MKQVNNYSEVLVDCLGLLKMLRGQMTEWVPQRELSFEADLLSEQPLRMKSLECRGNILIINRANSNSHDVPPVAAAAVVVVAGGSAAG